jgi:dCMP deaminase
MKEFLKDLLDKGEISLVDTEFARDMLREAYRYAYRYSTDKNTKTGAVIVLHGEIVARGTNKFAENVKITEKRNTPISKRVYQDHAERNAIYHAAKLGVPLDEAKMYATWVPCPACANAIINSSINELIFHYEMAIKTEKDWAEDLKESLKMLIEAGVKVSMFKGQIGNCNGLFKGQIWEP